MSKRTSAKRRWFWFLALLACGAAILSFRERRRHEESRYDSLIQQAAVRHQLDPALIKAVIWRESRFRADARGSAGELGLMQVRSAAAQEWAQEGDHSWFSRADLREPRDNIEVGSWYLAKLTRRYHDTDNPSLYALADYNAGRANVLRWTQGAAKTSGDAFLKRIDFPTTRDYVRAILNRRLLYESTFRRPPARS